MVRTFNDLDERPRVDRFAATDAAQDGSRAARTTYWASPALAARPLHPKSKTVENLFALFLVLFLSDKTLVQELFQFLKLHCLVPSASGRRRRRS